MFSSIYLQGCIEIPPAELGVYAAVDISIYQKGTPANKFHQFRKIVSREYVLAAFTPTAVFRCPLLQHKETVRVMDIARFLLQWKPLCTGCVQFNLLNTITAILE